MPASENTKDTVAKVGFAAVIAAAMGPVGILVAALSIGIDRAIFGEGGRETSQDLTAQQVADQRQWLAEDRAWRQQVRAARREWWDAGADPDKEPARPSTAERTGRWWRRLWARMVVASDDFRRGFRDGWHAAKDAREQGATWWETARTRPDHPDADDLDWDWADEPAAGKDPQPGPESDRDDTPHLDPVPAPKPATPQQDQPKQPDTNPTSQEDPMTAPTSTAPGAAPQGETNLDTLDAILAQINTELNNISDDVDRLNSRRMTLAGLVAHAFEIAQSTGATAATRAALDAAMSVVNQLGQHMGQVSDATAKAEDEVLQAKAGLVPARDAQDQLHASGARGEFVSASTTG